MTDTPTPKTTVRNFLPETRTWIMFGLFALTFYVFHMIETKPALEDNKLFFGLATLIVGTFFGGAVGFYFGSSQGSSAKSTTIDTLTDLVPKVAAPVTVVNTTAEPVPVNATSDATATSFMQTPIR